MKSTDGGILFARTMDWHDYSPEPLRLPANYSWQGAYNSRKFTNKYAILGIGRHLPDLHADISDGVNEHGLAVQKLTFSNRSEYAQSASEEKIQLAPFEFPLWLLGNCRSVEEIIAKKDEIQLMSDAFSLVKYGEIDLHFSATDPSGRMINIEPREQKLVIVENPIGVLTNAPNFEREVGKLADYMELTEEPQELNKISTGDFSGKPVFPGGFSPRARFIRAAILKEHALTPENSEENLIETWHILNSVTVPKSSGRSDTHTVYFSVVDLVKPTLYYQFYKDLNVHSMSL
jgi:choloylglycine hydrolase